MAQERKKRRIVLASVLKPVDDTRMFEKMAISLAKDAANEVTVIGFPGAPDVSHANIHLISLPRFARLSFQRWKAKWIVFSKVLKLRPALLVITTHELLLPAVLLKLFTRLKIIYDIRENYYRNIIHTNSFPRIVQIPLALLVRLKEKLLAPFISHFFLAEKGYEHEFSFFAKRYTVIENKAIVSRQPQREKKKPEDMRLLFSGTLAASTGVFRSIELAKQLHALDSSVKLTIIGSTPVTRVLNDIQASIAGCDYITLIGGAKLVPHQQIIDAIQQAEVGIIAYPFSEHTCNSKPTKLFEYLAYQLPVILDSQWKWIKEYSSHNAFVVIDFDNTDYMRLLRSILTGSFYTTIPEDVTWESEERRFTEIIQSLVIGLSPPRR